jgi:hypothetical protein
VAESKSPSELHIPMLFGGKGFSAVFKYFIEWEELWVEKNVSYLEIGFCVFSSRALL